MNDGRDVFAVLTSDVWRKKAMPPTSHPPSPPASYMQYVFLLISSTSQSYDTFHISDAPVTSDASVSVKQVAEVGAAGIMPSGGSYKNRFQTWA
jgi:hypothetical protein